MTWLYDLQTLAARFGCGVASDMAAMNLAQLWVDLGFSAVSPAFLRG